MSEPAVLRVPPDPRAVRTARTFAVAAVARLGADDGAQDAVRTLVSELVTNVLLHARTDALLLIADQGQAVRVAVVDGSPAVPEQRRLSAAGTTGRGLRLLRALSTANGVVADSTVSPDGKAVWFLVGKLTVDDPAAAAQAFLGHDLEQAW